MFDIDSRESTHFMRRGTKIHSVSKETHHEFPGFPCDPGSRSSDPGGVTFDHAYLKQVAKDPIRKRQMVLPIS